MKDKKDRYEKDGWIKTAERCYVLPGMPDIWETLKDNLDYKKLSKENEKYFKDKNDKNKNKDKI